jgi:hypothetical protein
MKFGRLLRDTAEELPEMASLFAVYKQLKKQLKKIPGKDELAHLASVQARGGRGWMIMLSRLAACARSPSPLSRAPRRRRPPPPHGPAQHMQ